MYYRLRACCWALKGEAARAEQSLAQARTLTDEFPSRPSRYEMHRVMGKVALLLGRREEARTQFLAALGLALHPLEKHTTRYWLGLAAEACNHPEEAVPLFSAVVNDGFTKRISTITPLAGLTKLRGLVLQNSLIQDIKPLSGLKRLTSLKVKHKRAELKALLAELSS
jgi:hypothetical protein